MNTNTSTAAVELTSLLSTHTATLVYTIPLLAVSILLTFAGTFLTLDRTRSFPPKHGESDTFVYSYETFERGRKRECCWWWRLEGGVGGMAVGFAFGAHLVTFLALLVPNISTSAPLSASAFLAVCYISAVLSSFISGRYSVAVAVFASLAGGISTSMTLSIMLHPSLLGRRILLIILTIFIAFPTIFIAVTTPHLPNMQSNTCLAYLPRLAHPLFRYCTASTGSFGLIISISLLLKPPAKSWANIWERFWVSDGIGWGTSQEKGLAAAWVFFTCLGILEDWALRKWLGENPDQKWDDYLSSYVHSLPYYSNRAGTFKPLPSLWDRLFRTHTNDFPSSSNAGPDFDTKFRPLPTDDDPILKSAIPDPFYADVPPPTSHFVELGDKHKLKLGNAKPIKRSSNPYNDDDNTHKNDNGASDDNSDDYDLPVFIKRRRKKGRFGKFRLKLYNPDNGINSHPADAKDRHSSGGFKPLDKAQDGIVHRDGVTSENAREAKLRANRSDNLVTAYMSQGRDTGGNTSTSNTVSSATLVGSGSGNTQSSDRGPEAHTDRQDKLAIPTLAAPDYSDYSDCEVDLTSLAPSPMVSAQRGQDRKREVVKGDENRVSKFMERQLSLSTLLPPGVPIPHAGTTANSALATADRTIALVAGAAPSAADRARARVRAFVSGIPVHVPGPNRRSSLPISPLSMQSPPILQAQQHREKTISPTPMSSGQGEGLLSPASFPASVPATPSLLNALRRVAAAQQKAYGLQDSPDSTFRPHDDNHGGGVDGLPVLSGAGDSSSDFQGQSPWPITKSPQPRTNGPKRDDVPNNKDGAGAEEWDEFWKDVKAQARAPIR